MTGGEILIAKKNESELDRIQAALYLDTLTCRPPSASHPPKNIQHSVERQLESLQ